MATPCRRKLSGEFSKVASHESLEKKGSSVSLTSTDRKAVFHRDRTIDQVLDSPADIPKTTPEYRCRKKTGKAEAMETAPNENKKDLETEKVEKEEQQDSKGSGISEGGQTNKSTPATRVRDYLKQQKEKKGKKVEGPPKETKPKDKESEADKKNDQSKPKAKAKAKVQPKNDNKKNNDKSKEAEVTSADDDDDDDGEDHDVVVTEDAKTKAHAMYMKYWRSMNSH